MTQKEMIQRIADATGITQTKAKEVLKTTFKVISTVTKNGGEIRVTDFGTFKHHIRKSRLGINPKTKEKITIPAKSVMKFKSSINIWK